jgi:putative heme-binding domain-containing protein
VLQRAQALAANEKADADARATAVNLLAISGTTAHQALFQNLVDPREPEAVQVAAVRALRRIGDAATAQSLLAKWRAMAPDVRSEAIPVFLHRAENVRLLLSAVKSGDVQPWQLNAYKPRLFMQRDPDLRAMARSLLEENPAEREKVLRRYQAALDMSGDVPRARQTFRRVCSKCHQLDGVGTAVGPNLGTVRNHPKSELLTDILLPSKSIERGYETYVVVKKTGESADGILSAQTPASITLRQEQGKQVTISRADIRDMYVSNLSLMPEDLDKQLSVQDVADLLAYLKNAR